MIPTGYTNALLILPFDHRGSFAKTLMGFKPPLSRAEKKKISEMKEMVYKGFLKARSKRKDKASYGILVDEEYGSKILKDANKRGIITACPVEKSGQKEFMFDFGNKFRDHIRKVNPSIVKVLVRYNPTNNKESNKRQLKRLHTLSTFCHKEKYKLMFELLVPPSEKDLKKCKTAEKYDTTLRLDRTVKAIKEVQTKVHPDIWKLEGFAGPKWKRIIAQVKKQDTKEGIIVLGRGADKEKVKKWLIGADQYKQIVGFAVGRTVFFKPLEDYKNKKITKTQAIDRIAKRYGSFINLWKKYRK